MELKDPDFRAALDAHLARYGASDDARAVRELLETALVYAGALWLLPLAFHAARHATDGAAALGYGAFTVASTSST